MSDPAQTDALAAEYVLGTLDFDERTQAQALLVIDPEFVAKVRLWERRLGELHLMVEPVEPDGKIWDRIKAKMPPPPPEVKPAEPSVEPPAPAPPIPAPPAAEASDADTISAATPEPTPVMTSGFDPLAATLPAAPSIPLPAGPVPSLTPSVTPGVLPSSVSSPASVLPSSMVRPLPGAFADIPPVPGFLTGPPLDSLPPAPAPASAAAAVLAPSVPQPAEIERHDRTQGTRRGHTFWRMLAMLMTLVVVALGGLIAAWKFAPEHVPPALHPLELMRAAGITVSGAPPARKPAPPESQFDE
jgi:anti-sigma-K factor RskA